LARRRLWERSDEADDDLSLAARLVDADERWWEEKEINEAGVFLFRSRGGYCLQILP
jgi:hypothetical protein